jgi:acetate---CoA ligase (ADP-forming)
VDRAPLDRLFRPRSVALIGASTDPGKISGRPLHFLVKHGFTGDIWPVNPNAESIEELPCFPDVESLPGGPDVALVLVGPAHAEKSIRALREIGTGAAIVLAGGFGEAGEDGLRRQNALLEAAGDMRLLGPNTIGLMNMIDGITLSASGALDAEDRYTGGVAVISQSGGILGSLMSRAAAHGIGLSHLVATGNEADIDVSDAIAYLAQDDATRVIALYLETIRKPDRFRRAAMAAAKAGKRLVIYKVGRSEAGSRSAASHTGALAGEDRVFDALFRQVGAIRAERYSDLIDIPAGLAQAPALRGKRIAIVSHTGGAAGLVADVCGMAGFDIPPPSPATTKRLAALMQDAGFAPNRNPVDLTLAGLDPEVTYGAIMALAESDDYDAVIPVVGSSSVGRPHLVADPVIRAMDSVKKPIIVYTSPSAPGIVKRLNAAGIPAFESPEACATLLQALHTKPESTSDTTTTAARHDTLPAEFQNATGPLNEAEAKRLFAAFGIGTVRETAITTAVDAPDAAREIGDPVVVKLLARELLHKTEVGAVRLNVAPQDAGTVCAEIEISARNAGVKAPEGFLLQEQIRDSVELILGFRRDPALGPAILLGAGGTFAEIYDDVAIGLLPLGRNDIRGMIGTLKLTPLLDGYRGHRPADIDGLIETVSRFAVMCAALDKTLIEAEINPLFVGDTETGIRAGDGVVVFSDRQPENS